MESQEQEQGAPHRENLEPVGDVLKRLPTKNTSEASHQVSGQEAIEAQEEYSCPICRDYHFVHPPCEDGVPDYSRTVPCSCVREIWAEKKRLAMLRMCELPKKAQG